MKHITTITYKRKEIHLPKVIWERFRRQFPNKTNEQILEIYAHVMNLDENDLEYGHFFPNCTDALLENMKEKF